MQPKTVYIRQKVDRKEPTRLTSSNGQNYEVKGSYSLTFRITWLVLMVYDSYSMSHFSLRVRFWVVQGNAPIRKTIAIVNKNSSNNYQVIFEITPQSMSHCSCQNKPIISVFNTSNCSCDTKIKWSTTKDCFHKKSVPNYSPVHGTSDPCCFSHSLLWRSYSRMPVN